jgi:putative redox protein
MRNRNAARREVRFMARPVHIETARGLAHEVWVGPHRLTVDEPPETGGMDAGPTPVELLLAALGT